MGLSQSELRDVLDSLEDGIASKDVPVPELGGKVLRVREMSGSLRNSYEAYAMKAKVGVADDKDLDRITLRMLRACVVNDQGKTILTESMAEKLFANHPRAAFRLRQAIFEVSAVDEEDLKEFAEDFDDAPSELSSSDSESTSD